MQLPRARVPRGCPTSSSGFRPGSRRRRPSRLWSCHRPRECRPPIFASTVFHCSTEHFLCVCGVARDRFLTQHVLSGLESRDGPLCMERSRCRDVDRVERVVCGEVLMRPLRNRDIVGGGELLGPVHRPGGNRTNLDSLVALRRSDPCRPRDPGGGQPDAHGFSWSIRWGGPREAASRVWPTPRGSVRCWASDRKAMDLATIP